MSLYPVRNASGRYDNVDFRKAAGHKLPSVKVNYLRRDILLFVRRKLLAIAQEANSLLGSCHWREERRIALSL
jgi:hypothetical protein